MKRQQVYPRGTRGWALALPAAVLLLPCLRGGEGVPAKPPPYPDRADLLAYTDDAGRYHPVKNPDAPDRDGVRQGPAQGAVRLPGGPGGRRPAGGLRERPGAGLLRPLR